MSYNINCYQYKLQGSGNIIYNWWRFAMTLCLENKNAWLIVILYRWFQIFCKNCYCCYRIIHSNINLELLSCIVCLLKFSRGHWKKSLDVFFTDNIVHLSSPVNLQPVMFFHSLLPCKAQLVMWYCGFLWSHGNAQVM